MSREKRQLLLPCESCTTGHPAQFQVPSSSHQELKIHKPNWSFGSRDLGFCCADACWDFQWCSEYLFMLSYLSSETRSLNMQKHGYFPLKVMGFLLGSMIRVHFLSQDMEHPVAPNYGFSYATASIWETKLNTRFWQKISFQVPHLSNHHLAVCIVKTCYGSKKKKEHENFWTFRKKDLTKLKLFSMVSDTKRAYLYGV